MSKTGIALVAALALAAVAPASAHHSFSTDYDWKRPVTLSGTVTRVDWANPHTVMTLTSNDRDGASRSWTVEMAKPTLLLHYGWNEKLLKSGDRVSIDGWVAKDGSARMNARAVSLSDGRQLFAASSFFQVPPPVTRQAP